MALLVTAYNKLFESPRRERLLFRTLLLGTVSVLIVLTSGPSLTKALVFLVLSIGHPLLIELTEAKRTPSR